MELGADIRVEIYGVDRDNCDEVVDLLNRYGLYPSGDASGGKVVVEALGEGAVFLGMDVDLDTPDFLGDELAALVVSYIIEQDAAMDHDARLRMYEPSLGVCELWVSADMKRPVVEVEAVDKVCETSISETEEMLVAMDDVWSRPVRDYGDMQRAVKAASAALQRGVKAMVAAREELEQRTGSAHRKHFKALREKAHPWQSPACAEFRELCGPEITESMSFGDWSLGERVSV